MAFSGVTRVRFTAAPVGHSGEHRQVSGLGWGGSQPAAASQLAETHPSRSLAPPPAPSPTLVPGRAGPGRDGAVAPPRAPLTLPAWSTHSGLPEEYLPWRTEGLPRQGRGTGWRTQAGGELGPGEAVAGPSTQCLGKASLGDCLLSGFAVVSLPASGLPAQMESHLPWKTGEKAAATTVKTQCPVVPAGSGSRWGMGPMRWEDR